MEKFNEAENRFAQLVHDILETHEAYRETAIAELKQDIVSDPLDIGAEDATGSQNKHESDSSKILDPALTSQAIDYYTKHINVLQPAFLVHQSLEHFLEQMFELKEKDIKNKDPPHEVTMGLMQQVAELKNKALPTQMSKSNELKLQILEKISRLEELKTKTLAECGDVATVLENTQNYLNSIKNEHPQLLVPKRNETKDESLKKPSLTQTSDQLDILQELEELDKF
ncbi:hypothetical protein ACO0QE_002290 [Hanseniaspora vineae]